MRVRVGLGAPDLGPRRLEHSLPSMDAISAHTVVNLMLGGILSFTSKIDPNKISFHRNKNGKVERLKK